MGTGSFVKTLNIALVIFAGAIIGWLLPSLFKKWRLSRLRSETSRDPLNAPPHKGVLNPESQFLVRFDDSEIVCQRPDGKTERVRWDNLEQMEVRTNSDGPFLPDCFWVLKGVNGGCIIPQGATGDAELLKRLQELPAFDNGQFIEAMGSTSENTFVCWKRSV